MRTEGVRIDPVIKLTYDLVINPKYDLAAFTQLIK
jgi:hypothetical protein